MAGDQNGGTGGPRRAWESGGRGLLEGWQVGLGSSQQPGPAVLRQVLRAAGARETRGPTQLRLADEREQREGEGESESTVHPSWLLDAVAAYDSAHPRTNYRLEAEEEEEEDSLVFSSLSD